MKNRKRIEQACQSAGFIIKELRYSREYVPTPEEMVPIGWILQAQVSDEPDDIMEFTGTADDVIAAVEFESVQRGNPIWVLAVGEIRDGSGVMSRVREVFDRVDTAVWPYFICTKENTEGNTADLRFEFHADRERHLRKSANNHTYKGMVRTLRSDAPEIPNGRTVGNIRTPDDKSNPIFNERLEES